MVPLKVSRPLYIRHLRRDSRWDLQVLKPIHRWIFAVVRRPMELPRAGPVAVFDSPSSSRCLSSTSRSHP